MNKLKYLLWGWLYLPRYELTLAHAVFALAEIYLCFAICLGVVKVIDRIKRGKKK